MFCLPEDGGQEAPQRNDILDDELTLKWGVSPQAFEELGQKLLRPFKGATDFALVLSGRVVPTNTYVNVWEVPSASAVQKMWSTLGKAGQGEFGKNYNSLNNMVLEENQQILYSYATERPQKGRSVIYLRNRYWVEPEDLQSFRDSVLQTKWSEDLRLVGLGLAFTGKLNVFTVYLALAADPKDIVPKPNQYSALDDYLKVFDEKVSRRLPFHSILYRPATPQVLIPTLFDPSVFPPG